MNNQLKVSILMGSDSDLALMEKSKMILEEFNVGYEMRVLSAHRTPKETVEYIEDAEKRGTQIFIAAAGLAAHLPGVVAAHTVLPVIGVPVASGALRGQDALLSIAQMPSGIPVASVAIDGSTNAALLAVSILATSDAQMKERLLSYREAMRAKVLSKKI